MNRVEAKFKALKAKNKFAFMPFVVAGDPDFKESLKIIKQLVGRSDFLEIGFPYSDPLSDGPVIQRANQRALSSGMNAGKVFKLIKSIRSSSNIPITVLVYANLVLQRGINQFYKDAKIAGIDAVLVPDLPVEEAEGFVKAANENHILPIFLVTQTTTAERLAKVLKVATGFIYLVSVLGVTGQRKGIDQATFLLIKRVQSKTRLPIAVGFGISAKQHLKQLKSAGADGAVVGSSLIQALEKDLSIKKYLDALGV